MNPPAKIEMGRSLRRGATLLELLASMAIASVLFLVLGAILQSALARFREGADAIGERSGARLAAEWLERDLASHQSSRAAALPRLPAAVSETQREFFENRLLFPFEIDRRSGSGSAAGRSFANAAPEFDSIAFVTRMSDGEDPAAGAPAIVGYYVAYARDSPMLGDETAGMKLFRHCRRGGHATGDGYADASIRYLSSAINDASAGAPRPPGEANPAAVRVGRFENRDLPFLISLCLDDRHDSAPRAAAPAWPALPVTARLSAPPPDPAPPRGGPDDWSDPASAVHNSVFPDEPVCGQVVRFEVTPYRRVEVASGGRISMGATELNAHLGLSGGSEWPVLVAPDWIEVVISVLPVTTARRLVRYEDWIVDWSRAGSDPAADPFGLVAASRTHRFRIVLPPRSS